MNIVFAVENNDGWNSIISSRFGRANGYIRYSQESDKISYHSNNLNVNAGHGAGIQASQSVINLEADIVITGGNMGPKAFEVLKAADIIMHANVGEITVQEAYSNYQNKIYKELLTSNK